MVDDEVAGAEEEQTEEDKEVQRIVDQGKGVKRKLLTGKGQFTVVETVEMM